MARRLEDMMENLMVVQQNQMSSDELIRARISKNENIIMSLAKQFEGQDIRITTIEDRIENIELNEEITHEQNREIKLKANRRVSEMLDLPRETKYYQIFIMNLYGYLRRNYQLGSPIAITRKKHYDTVMKGIETWSPDTQILKDKKDNIDKFRGEK